LKKKGIVQGNGEKGQYQFTAKAMKLIQKNQPLALPAPAHFKKKKKAQKANGHAVGGAGKSNGIERAGRGSGPAALRALLTQGPMTPSEIRASLAGNGVSAKSVSGILDRGKRDKLIKKVGDKYELTAKGSKTDEAAATTVGA
jgi:predicted transcriptional regulator